MNIQRPICRCEAVAISGSGRGSSGWRGEVRPGLCDGVEHMKVVKGDRFVPFAVFPPVHVDLASCRRESMAIPSPRWQSVGSIGEVSPGHRDGVEGVKVAQTIVMCINTPVHVELAPRRSEAMQVSGWRWCARRGVGKVCPGHGNWIKDVQVVEESCTQTVVCDQMSGLDYL